MSIKIKKKRGRKPSGKIINYKEIEKKEKKKSEEECIITHIPINFSDLNNESEDENEDQYQDQEISDIFLKHENSSMSSETEIINSSMSKDKMVNIIQKKINKLQILLNQLENPNAGYGLNKKIVHNMDINFGSKWPEKTNIHCWWCTLKFDTPPVSLPNKFYNKKFYVFGCFCSFNCS